MSKLSKQIAWALAIGLVLVQVFPVAADLLVCIADRPDRGCCEAPSVPAPRLVEGGDCSCCVKVQVVSNTADPAVQKSDGESSFESEGVHGHVAPVTRRIASVGGGEPDDPRLPSLRTVVLLI